MYNSYWKIHPYHYCLEITDEEKCVWFSYFICAIFNVFS